MAHEIRGGARIDGHIEIDGDPGSAGQLYLSGGANNPGAWGGGGGVVMSAYAYISTGLTTGASLPGNGFDGTLIDFPGIREAPLDVLQGWNVFSNPGVNQGIIKVGGAGAQSFGFATFQFEYTGGGTPPLYTLAFRRNTLALHTVPFTFAGGNFGGEWQARVEMALPFSASINQIFDFQVNSTTDLELKSADLTVLSRN